MYLLKKKTAFHSTRF